MSTLIDNDTMRMRFHLLFRVSLIIERLPVRRYLTLMFQNLCRDRLSYKYNKDNTVIYFPLKLKVLT